MFDSSTLLLFVTASLALLLVPGPAVLYIVARSLHQGRLAGLVSTLGVNVGALFHIAAAALGVSALLMSSALAFKVVQLLGAAYLIGMGVQKLLEKDPDGTPEQVVPQESLWKIFRQGVMVNLLNPKTAIFFLAFLPQFVRVEKGHQALQILTLGMLFILLAFLSDTFYTLLAGTIGNRLRRAPGFFSIGSIMAATVYIALGLITAFSGAKQS